MRLLRNKRGELRGIWIGDAPPAEFQAIGVDYPREGDRRGIRPNASSWAWIVGTIERAMNLRSPTAKVHGVADESQARGALSASDVEQIFGDWEGAVPASAVNDSRRIISETLKEMQSAADGGAAKLKALESAICKFNDLDERQQFINTMEREDILEQLQRLGMEYGLGDVTNTLDRGRNW